MAPQDPPSPAFAAVVAAAERERLGLYRVSYRPQRMSTAALIGVIVLGLALLIIVVGVIFFVLAALSPNLNKKRAARRLHVFEHGLILSDHNGPTQIYRWDAVTALQKITDQYVNGVFIRRTFEYTIVDRAGTRTKITNFFERPEEWGPGIQNEITRAQLPVVLAALDSGAALQFGPLTINKGGLATGSKSLRWDEIQDIDVHQGYVRIKKTSGWIRWSSTAVSVIPNLIVFLAAAGQLSRRPT
jgi:hypothetical protein